MEPVANIDFLTFPFDVCDFWINPKDFENYLQFNERPILSYNLEIKKEFYKNDKTK